MNREQQRVLNNWRMTSAGTWGHGAWTSGEYRVECRFPETNGRAGRYVVTTDAERTRHLLTKSLTSPNFRSLEKACRACELNAKELDERRAVL